MKHTSSKIAKIAIISAFMACGLLSLGNESTKMTMGGGHNKDLTAHNALLYDTSSNDSVKISHDSSQDNSSSLVQNTKDTSLASLPQYDKGFSLNGLQLADVSSLRATESGVAIQDLSVDTSFASQTQYDTHPLTPSAREGEVAVSHSAKESSLVDSRNDKATESNARGEKGISFFAVDSNESAIAQTLKASSGWGIAKGEKERTSRLLAVVSAKHEAKFKPLPLSHKEKIESELLKNATISNSVGRNLNNVDTSGLSPQYDKNFSLNGLQLTSNEVNNGLPRGYASRNDGYLHGLQLASNDNSLHGLRLADNETQNAGDSTHPLTPSARGSF